MICEFNLRKFLKNNGMINRPKVKKIKVIKEKKVKIKKPKVIKEKVPRVIKRNRKTKYTFEYISNYIEENSNCRLMEILNKRSSSSPIKIKCECGEEHIIKFLQILKNKENIECEQCRKLKGGKNIPTNWYYDKVKNFVETNSGCKLISTEYKGIDEKLLFKCRCGNEFDTTFNKFYHRNQRQCKVCGLKICTFKRTKTHDEYLSEFNLVTNKEYEMLSKYEKSENKILVRHNICGYEWEVAPFSILCGNGCPICKSSKGEKKIKECLDSFNFEYIIEHTFEDLKDKDKLRFDFGIFNDKEKINLKYLVEYDGEFHYNPIKMNSMELDYEVEDRFKLQLYHDGLKNEYCIKNKIPLVRIPYWDFENIQEILNDILINNNMESIYIINKENLREN